MTMTAKKEQELVVGGRTAPADGSGSAYTAVASEPIQAGQMVYIKSNGQLALASAATEGKEAVGFCLQSFTQGSVAMFFNRGLITGLSGLTPGQKYYLAIASGGVDVAPVTAGNVFQLVGTALSASQLIFNLGYAITL